MVSPLPAATAAASIEVIIVHYHHSACPLAPSLAARLD